MSEALQQVIGVIHHQHFTDRTVQCRVSLLWDQQFVIDPLPTPEQTLLNKEAGPHPDEEHFSLGDKDVQSRIKQLPTREQEYLFLRLKGLRQAEIAKKCHVHQGAVSEGLKRARRSLARKPTEITRGELAALPEDDQQLFLLEGEGLSQTEIGRRLGKKQSWISWRRERVLRGLGRYASRYLGRVVVVED